MLLQELAQETESTSRATFEQEESVREKQLDALNSAMEPHNLCVAENVPYDGNCYFSTILKLVPDASHDPCSLRRALHGYVISAECPSEISQSLDSDFLADLATPYKEMSDDRVVSATVHMLKCTVTVYTVSANRIVRTATHGTQQPHIFVGHIEDKHFVPLTPLSADSTKKRKRSDSVPSAEKRPSWSFLVPDLHTVGNREPPCDSEP